MRSAAGVVTLRNVYVGLAVVRGPHWMRHWREDAVGGEVRGMGRVVGFFDDDGRLVGRRANGEGGPAYAERAGWCAVHWLATQREVAYPIGVHVAFMSGARRYALCAATAFMRAAPPAVRG